jgi:hypothetical protein
VHDAVGWAVRLAKRVEELHRLGVAHGGVSANIVLSDGPSCQGRGVLGDVREAASRPSYHSPERHDGRGISPADDTWGAAVTLYLLLTGQFPFAGTSPDELRQRMASSSPAPLAVFDTGDDRLQAILDRFLARTLSKRTTNMGAFRQALEAWYPPAAHLHPLEESDDDSLTDFDDDDEDIATVMRDFSEIRAQLAAMGAEGEVRQAAAQPRRPSPSRPASGRGVPVRSAPAPRPIVTPGVRAPMQSVPGMAPPRGSSPGIPAAHESAPGMRGPMGSAPGPGAPAPYAEVPPARGSAPGMPEPRGSQPGMQAPAPAPAPPPAPPPAWDIDDDDSDEAQATVMMDTSAHEVHAAIEAALASAPEQVAPWASSQSDDEPDGGQRTIGLFEAGMEFPDVPDPTGGEAPTRPPAPPPAAGQPARMAAPVPPAAEPPAAEPPAGPRGGRPELPKDLTATAAFPEDMLPSLDYPGLDAPELGHPELGHPGLDAPGLDAPGLGHPGAGHELPAGPTPAATAPGVGAGFGAPGAVGAGGVAADGDPAEAPRPVEMFVPEPEPTGGGLRVALGVATAILILVVVGVALLWLDRQGTIDLGI